MGGWNRHGVSIGPEKLGKTDLVTRAQFAGERGEKKKQEWVFVAEKASWPMDGSNLKFSLMSYPLPFLQSPLFTFSHQATSIIFLSYWLFSPSIWLNGNKDIFHCGDWDINHAHPTGQLEPCFGQWGWSFNLSSAPLLLLCWSPWGCLDPKDIRFWCGHIQMNISEWNHTVIAATPCIRSTWSAGY